METVYLCSQPCLTQWNYQPCSVGTSKTDGSCWRVLTKCGPLEKGMANHFSILALNSWAPFTVWKGKKDKTLKVELPRSIGAQYATGEQWRNNSRKNEEMEPKQKQHPVVDVTGDGSKVWCCKEQYYIGSWNVKSANQGKLEVVKQEMARMNVNMLGMNKLIWSSRLNSPIAVHISLFIPNMLTFILAISSLTTSNLPWFADLTFQDPM